MNNNIKETLDELGYSPKLSGEYWLCRAVFRDGDNKNALSINRRTGYFIDFVTRKKGRWEDFLALATGNNKELISKYKNGDFVFQDELPKISYLSRMQIKKYDKSLLKKLLPLYDFYLKKGISRELLIKYDVGLATNAKMKNRLVFPIYNEKEEIIGFAGRTITPPSDTNPKWIIIGKKTNFAYPLHLKEVRESIKKKREIILVESVGDLLALNQAGLYNVMCIFGISVLKETLKQVISLNPTKIILALNNDEGKKINAGIEAMSRLQKDLAKFFDKIICIVPPNQYNDWGKCTTEQIVAYFDEKN